jgi:site-specific recombinase XerD
LSFFDFAENHIQELKKKNNIGNWKKYGSVLKKLKDFIAKKALLFQDIDAQCLESFQAYLKTKHNKQTTIHANFRAIRAWFYKAIDTGLVQ